MSAARSPRAVPPPSRHKAASAQDLRPPPLFAGAWRALTEPQRKAARPGFIEILDERLAGDDVMEVGEIRMCKPPFYAEACLWEVDVWRGGSYAGVLDVLSHDDGAVLVLNGTSPPIHMTNARRGVLLQTPQQARDYVTFFCNAVHGDEGAFSIFSQWGDIPLSSAEGRSARDALSEAFPNWLDVELSPVDAEEDRPVIWRASTCIFYASHTFRASLALEAGGMVRMDDDKPVDAILPVRATVYRKGLRRLE